MMCASIHPHTNTDYTLGTGKNKLQCYVDICLCF